MFERFGLTLMVNHGCNLRCRYCYTGDKTPRAMTAATARAGIDRALRSLVPDGVLELAFFGGEPLIEAELIWDLMGYSREQAIASGASVVWNMTTNGTLAQGTAWRVMTHPEMQLAISHDGLTEIHDRHRVTVEGHGSSATVLNTIDRLVAVGKEFRVVMVVRPDSVASLPEGIERLYKHGVRRFDPSLDLWTKWGVEDVAPLKASLRKCADFWSARLPEISISCLDEKAARIADVPSGSTARCGFGSGEVAVAPSGLLYPCERLIGADTDDHPHRLPGDVFAGEDFLTFPPVPGKTAEACTSCAINSLCSTTCRCSNLVRTGDVSRPDGLLCLWDQTCYREALRVLQRNAAPAA